MSGELVCEICDDPIERQGATGRFPRFCRRCAQYRVREQRKAASRRYMERLAKGV